MEVENHTFVGWYLEPMFRPSLLNWPKDDDGWDKLGVLDFPAVVSWNQIRNIREKDKSNNITFLLIA